MNKIDGSYRLLFSNPQLVRDLFDGIINEPGLSTLDWSGLTHNQRHCRRAGFDANYLEQDSSA